VGQLAQLLIAENALDEAEFVETVKDLARDGSFVLQEPSYKIDTVLDYLFTLTLSGWFWSTLAVTALALLSVTLIPDLFPLNTLRWVLGSIFVLYLPGYTLLQFLFPKRSEFDALERFALSIGVSLAIVPLIGLLLNYTPWGIRLAPITASLGIFTIATAVVAATRKYMEIRE
jgi:uncharacterized membrane protein